MTGITLDDLRDAIKNNHEIEFYLNDKPYTLQPEIRGDACYPVIWSTNDTPTCIAETPTSISEGIQDRDISALLETKCFDGKSFTEVSPDISISVIY